MRVRARAELTLCAATGEKYRHAGKSAGTWVDPKHRVDYPRCIDALSSQWRDDLAFRIDPCAIPVQVYTSDNSTPCYRPDPLRASLLRKRPLPLEDILDETTWRYRDTKPEFSEATLEL